MPYLTSLFSKACYAPAQEIANILQSYNCIGIVAHANPDGDALGSSLALAHGLQSLHKKVLVANASPVPEYLSWLPFTAPMLQKFPSHTQPEIVVVLDCGDSARLGKLEESVLSFPTVNIDHHLANPLFGSEYNWVDSSMAATGQMVAAVLHALDVPLTGEAARCVYTALRSDTGNFSFGNTTEDVFLLNAQLLHHGLDIIAIGEHMDKTWHMTRMHLWGELMQSLRLERNGTIALVAISQELLAKHKATKDDLEGFAEHLRRIKGVIMSGLVREDKKNECKASLRSSGDIDVRAVASELGGGGHRNAAGVTLQRDLATSYEKIFSGMLKWLDEHDNKG